MNKTSQEKILLHPVDAWIDREPLDHSDVADLRDGEGNRLYRFPKAWSGDQIMTALDFANRTYAKGHKAGEQALSKAIRLLLEAN
jgi:hypothetical protein